MGKNYVGTKHKPKGYYDSTVAAGKRQRRPLPKVDLNKCYDDAEWLGWIIGIPIYPGWYWVTAKGVWPQIVEWRMIKGKLRALDRHSNGLWGENFWEKHAGPIPDPTSNPIKRKKGKP